MTRDEIRDAVLRFGFVEVRIDGGAVDGANYTDGCSGSRSDCCTRVCSAGCSQDGTFAGTQEAWEQFLFLKGGEIQY